jgi:hypothetical protein
LGNPLAIVRPAPLTIPPTPTLIIQASGTQGPAGQNASQEIMGVREGMPPIGAILFWYEFASEKLIDLANCRMRIGIPPLHNYVANVTSNGATQGTWTVLAGQGNGVLSLSKVDYLAGDDLQVIGPAVADPNLNDTLIIMALLEPTDG